MNTTQNPGRRLLRGLFVNVLLALFLSASLSAQTASTGTITGRVYNPRTGEYVRNAEVSVSGANIATVSGTGGTYRLVNVPAGPAEVVVAFAGYADQRTSTVVASGQTITVDFELTPAGGTAGISEDGTVAMSAFVVSTEVEGNAKALMEQRNSMDLGRSIASDVFGDVTEGNVGEFLKYLPGIEMEYVEADTRGPRLGGLNPEYTGVSVDGMKSASADGFMQYGGTENGSTGGGGRSFSFEQVSINSIESIEISRVTPPNLDADAPAGTINMKTKRAFDRRGRLVKWAVSTGFNSEEFTLSRTPGPGDDGLSRKFKPTLSFSFADSFLNNRLGVLLGYSNSNLYNEQYRVQHAYQRTPSAADPRPQVLTEIVFKDGPKWTNRTTYTGTIDFKATDNLMFGLNLIFNEYEAKFWNRNIAFRASANNTNATNGRIVAGGDGLTTFFTNSTSTGSAGNRYVATTGGTVTKQTSGYNISPKFEWRLGSLLIEGRLSSSKSDNSYGSLRDGRAGFGRSGNVTNIQFEATRPDPLSSEWTIVQTAGADWADLANYKNPGITDDVRAVVDEINIAALDFTYNTTVRNAPVVLRWGAKLREQTTNTDRLSQVSGFNYIGPGGGTTGDWSAYPSDFAFNPEALGPRVTSISGGGFAPFANTQAIGQLYLNNPELFASSFTSENYYDANFASVRRFKEEVPAAYIMANTRLGRFSLQGGLRWEDTQTTSNEFDPRTPSEVIAAGYTLNANGRATTVEGLDYQFASKPKVDRKGSYDRLFPSVSMKYRFSDNLIADLGAGHTIRRPEVTKLVGLYSINEDTEIITTSNPGLLPEFADRIAGSLSYYFGGTNNLTLTLAHTEIENLFINDEFTAEEFGIDDPALASYTVRTFRNSEDAVTFRSLELAYRQMLNFLPGALQGTSVFVNYSRTYASERRGGVTPHVISGGVDWRYKRLGFGLKGVWSDDAPWTAVEGRYRPSVLKIDGSIDFRISRYVTAFVQARNLTNEDHVIVEEIDGNVPVIWRRENYGANYVFGVRGQF
jgi:TonB-dependent receptor